MPAFRDMSLTLVIFGLLPIVVRRPEIGVLVWTWISLMSPHRLTWDFAYRFPFAQIVAICLLIGLLVWKEEKKIPWSPITALWAMFIAWMCVTTVFALNPTGALQGLEKSLKIQIISFVILIVMTTPERLKWFVWVMTFSIGFYGIKGGVFTLVRGGQFLVWGPAGSFISGNNELALALIMVLPFMRFLQMQMTSRWASLGFSACMLLCAASIIGSHSRGAFLAIIAMGLTLVWKSRRRLVMILVLIAIVPIALNFIPDKYWERMESIKEYEQDSSAMGRINAWTFAWNVAKDRPLVGGGFNTFTKPLFYVYAPDPNDFHDVHSIYFEVLAEQGFVGLVLFLSIGFLAYLTAGWTARKARGDPETTWQLDLARMTQVSLVGYAVGGAFLGLAYFDLFYNIVAIAVLNRLILVRRLAEQTTRLQPPDAVGAGRASPLSAAPAIHAGQRTR